ncbi:hypothetical protein GCM10027024_07430 [Microbacterium insulae]
MLDATWQTTLVSLLASEVEKGGPEMMHMNTTGVTAPTGGIATRLCAFGTVSFGAFQNSGFHTAG